MNLLLHWKLGLQGRVWPVTLWRKKSLPQKENFFALDGFILVCGEQGNWWVAVFLHLLSSPEVWNRNSVEPFCETSLSGIGRCITSTSHGHSLPTRTLRNFTVDISQMVGCVQCLRAVVQSGSFPLF